MNLQYFAVYLSMLAEYYKNLLGEYLNSSGLACRDVVMMQYSWSNLHV